MNRGFYIILAAQFLSALADNALLFAAIALLKELAAPPWQVPVLQQFFVVSYIVLAPFVGAFADALPKGKVMMLSNTIKFVGCLAMLLGLHPLFAYGIVGFGAAAYSPAKYGILTEYLPPKQLVVANSWMEGSTVLAIILGAVVGGLLIGPKMSMLVQQNTFIAAWSIAKIAIIIIASLYLSAAAFNLYIPKIALDHKPLRRNPLFLARDFWHSFKLLWKDPQGEISLAVTTLFWGAGATMRLVILTWAGAVLNFNLEQATQLTAMVAVGIAVGSVIAGKWVKLESATRVLPAGIVMGGLVIAMLWVKSLGLALVMFTLIGVVAGYFVVPMNALLQHRGHLLMGAGHSIAVQNFNENISILVMLGLYALMIKVQAGMATILLAFGGFVIITMSLIMWRERKIH